MTVDLTFKPTLSTVAPAGSGNKTYELVNQTYLGVALATPPAGASSGRTRRDRRHRIDCSKTTHR
jgi:hypothetical protein